MRSQVYSADEFSKILAVQGPLFGDVGLKETLYNDQLAAISDDLNREERNMPRECFALVGRRSIRRFTGDKSSLLKRDMSFAGRALFSSDGALAALTPVLREAYALLLSKTPTVTGALRNSYVYVINGSGGSKHLSPPRGGQWPYGTILGVSSRIDYSGAHESQGWTRPFRKTYLTLQRRYGSMLDIRFRWIFGDNIGGTVTRSGKQKTYYQPIIEIAHLNAMGGNTGVQRRSRKRRRVKR